MDVAERPDNESKVLSDELCQRKNSLDNLTGAESNKSAKKIKINRRDNKTDTNLQKLKPRSSFKKGNTYDVFDQMQDIYGSRENTFFKDDRQGETRRRKSRRKRKQSRQENDTKERLKNMKEVYTNKDGATENPEYSKYNKEKVRKKRKKRQKDKECFIKEEKKEQEQTGKYRQRSINKTVQSDTSKKGTPYQNFSKEKEKNDNSGKSQESESNISEKAHDRKESFINSKNETEELAADTGGSTDVYTDDFETDENSSQCTDNDSSDTENSSSDASEESHQPQSDKTNGCDSESELNISSYEDDGPVPKEKENNERDPSPPLPSYTPAPPLYQSPKHTPKDVDVNSEEIGKNDIIYLSV